MSKTTVDGLKEAKGNWGMPDLDPGWYTVQLNAPKVEEKESAKGTGTNYSFMAQIIDTTDQTEEQSSGMDPIGQNVFLNIYLMNEDHESYEKWSSIGKGQLKDLINKCDVPLKGNSFENEDFAGCTLMVKMGKRKDGNGMEVKEIAEDPEKK